MSRRDARSVVWFFLYFARASSSQVRRWNRPSLGADVASCSRARVDALEGATATRPADRPDEADVAVASASASAAALPPLLALPMGRCPHSYACGRRSQPPRLLVRLALQGRLANNMLQ